METGTTGYNADLFNWGGRNFRMVNGTPIYNGKQIGDYVYTLNHNPNSLEQTVDVAGLATVDGHVQPFIDDYRKRVASDIFNKYASFHNYNMTNDDMTIFDEHNKTSDVREFLKKILNSGTEEHRISR